MPEKKVNAINNMKQTHILRSHKIYNKTFKNKNIHKGGANDTVEYLHAKLNVIQTQIIYFKTYIINIIKLLLQDNSVDIKSFLSSFNTYVHAETTAIQVSYDFIDIILVFVSILNKHVTGYDDANIQNITTLSLNAKTGPDSIITQLEEIITLIK